VREGGQQLVESGAQRADLQPIHIQSLESLALEPAALRENVNLGMPETVALRAVLGDLGQMAAENVVRLPAQPEQCFQCQKPCSDRVIVEVDRQTADRRPGSC